MKQLSAVEFVLNLSNETHHNLGCIYLEYDDRLNDVVWSSGFPGTPDYNPKPLTRPVVEKIKLLYRTLHPRSRANIIDVIRQGTMLAPDRQRNTLRTIIQEEIDGGEFNEKLFTGEFLRDTLGAVESVDYLAIIEKKLLGGAMSKVLNPRVPVDVMPILIGNQDLGKDRFFEILFGLRSGLVRDIDIRLLEKGNQDEIYRKCNTSWIARIQEFAPRSEHYDALKAALTTHTISIRRPYERYDEDYDRSYIYVGTGNNKKFIPDEQGSRRFLPVIVNDYIDQDKLLQMRRDILYTAYHYVKNNQISLHMSREETEIANEYLTSEFLLTDTELERFIKDYVSDRTIVYQRDVVNDSQDIWESEMTDASASIRIGKILKSLDWKLTQKDSKYERGRSNRYEKLTN